MRILDRYIAKQILISSLYSIAVIMIILILGNVFKEILRELAKRPELSLGFVARFVALVIPISLSLAIPFSFLMSILLTFGRLSADSEFVSMRMAGQNLGRICLPVWLIAILFTGICGWFNLSVTPFAKTEMEGLKDKLINRLQAEPMTIFPDRQVMTDLDDHLIYAHKDGDTLRGLQIVKLVDDVPDTLAIARAAKVDAVLDAEVPEIIFSMDDLSFIIKGKEGNLIDSSQPGYMTQADLGFPLPSLGGGNEDVGDQPENISLRRLFDKVQDDTLEPRWQAIYTTQLSSRLAFSVSCIAFALIGVPLGITAQRRESTAGFVIAMIIAVIYYVMLTTFQLQQDQIERQPHLLVWIPNILLVALGIFLFVRLARK
ncbi:MAG: LptF/LptG family permease [Verrucomicrobiota bacterium]